MQRLIINNFSSIKFADLQLSALTIIIGPQASGKSVISKLIYFFNEQLSDLPVMAEENLTSLELERRIADEFVKWFPSSAWGDKLFKIRFEAGPFEISVRRRGDRKSQRANVNISPDLRVYYDTLIIGFNEASSDISGSTSFASSRQFQILSAMRRSNSSRLSSLLGDAFIDYQVFIPAGRSWFTSIGRAVAAFEHGGLLDPVTLNFGRMFTNARDLARSALVEPEDGPRRELMLRLFGGEIRFERNLEYVLATDGRKIPFNVLSSGQQELMPLWMVLSSISRQRPRRRDAERLKSLIFIEEPEAHLFPSAQSVLLEYLASIVSDRVLNQDMIITTHSPYVLSKINNLLKAGDLGTRNEGVNSRRVSRIVPRASWLRGDLTRAYAITEGKVIDILDVDGMIDGEYLDEISTDISRTFNMLLEVEYGDD